MQYLDFHWLICHLWDGTVVNVFRVQCKAKNDGGSTEAAAKLFFANNCVSKNEFFKNALSF